ncbi:secretin and TonB N-terminal domain-containing protein [Pigmentiphaga sp.]|uniref:secretin and TonB N-terminal domain-containing protein n=1 Tax=Pigmentiphaga sp. TaxID=1977564 RepID=UPI0025FAD5FA|nr:secretin and TonB N-terminal domain-containing protein [Pigmentiphaga sp.]
MARPHAAGLIPARAAWLLGMSWALIAPSWSADGIGGQGPAVSETAGPLVEFDIAAQPLESALFQYGEISLLPALYPSELTVGLRSAPVRGRFSPEDALRRLLQGTGLVAEKMASAHGDVFRLRRAAAPASPTDAADAPPAGRELDGYPARVQAGVLQALCSHPLTAPGPYRALFEVRVDATGQVSHVALLESTGERRRDAVLLAALQRIQVGAAPPAAAAPASYTVTLLPAAAGGNSPCRAQAEGVS